jgi:hypothetical protein
MTWLTIIYVTKDHGDVPVLIHDLQQNGHKKKDKQGSTKHYTEN